MLLMHYAINEFPILPACRQCKIDHSEFDGGCIKNIFPVHSQGHEDIHEMESHLFAKLGEKLRNHFLAFTSGYHIE